MKQLNGLLTQVLYSYQCPKSLLKAIATYGKNIEWETIKARGASKNILNTGRSYIHPSSTLKSVDSLRELHIWLEECLNDVRQSVGWREESVRDLCITQSWLNRSDIGEMHHKHTHALSILSGILYLSEPSSTRFYLPSIYALSNTIAGDMATNRLEIEELFEGSYGKLIIFPSALAHSVDPNLEPKARLTLSINSWFRGEVGVAEELVYLPESLNSVIKSESILAS
ncbi:hypothetical protein PMIT1342_00676 [Prochlorococcus marinus str. MIT 1342]|uniref:putative 2OG-Fe(II) oxygenase n=1 Tax=Prochlorococcus TaxID=1218 RepID=UPI0007BB6B39|nr:putative 2OG-Fe(II) oxygenase [Prochlorococcus marinus]KZR82679.1 hypothetical protein PMIT1342_00676 [Prochlorococcus marinus str. MIT 1342]